MYKLIIILSKHVIFMKTNTKVVQNKNAILVTCITHINYCSERSEKVLLVIIGLYVYIKTILATL